MSVITKQSMLKACYQLDQHEIPLRTIDGKPVGSMKQTEARVKLCDWWLSELQGLDTITWDKVIELMLVECKEYPGIEKLYEFINRASVPDETPSPAPLPPPKKQIVKNEHKNYITKMLELAKEGRWREAAQVVSAAAISKERINNYAKKYYPGKANSVWIEKNNKELSDLIREEERCDACMSVHRCATKGFTSVGFLDKYGNISVECVKCRKVEDSHEKIC